MPKKGSAKKAPPPKGKAGKSKPMMPMPGAGYGTGSKFS